MSEAYEDYTPSTSYEEIFKDYPWLKEYELGNGFDVVRINQDLKTNYTGHEPMTKELLIEIIERRKEVINE